MNGNFYVRIFTANVCLAKPLANLDACFSDFKQSQVNCVPVIQVFGSTPAGQSTCMNIHGVFPYLLVPYHGPLTDKNAWSRSISVYLHQMAASLDQALSLGNNKNEHVYKIILLQAKPFYGYHWNEEIYMKIYFYYPNDVKRAAELLLAGAVMNRSFQPHEAHIPFILQMLMDYNLYGMNLLRCKYFWFRKAISNPQDVEVTHLTSKPASSKSETELCSELNTVWSDSNILLNAFLPSDVAPKLSTCALEVDIVASDILNRNELAASSSCNPGIDYIWRDEKTRRQICQDMSLNIKSSMENRCLPVNQVEVNYLQVLHDGIKLQLSTTMACSKEQTLSTEKDDSETDECFKEIKQSISPIVDMDILSQVSSNSQNLLDQSGSYGDSLLCELLDMDTTERASQSSLTTQHSNGRIDDDDIESIHPFQSDEEEDERIMSQSLESEIRYLTSNDEVALKKKSEVDSCSNDLLDDSHSSTALGKLKRHSTDSALFDVKMKGSKDGGVEAVVSKSKVSSLSHPDSFGAKRKKILPELSRTSQVVPNKITSASVDSELCIPEHVISSSSALLLPRRKKGNEQTVTILKPKPTPPTTSEAVLFMETSLVDPKLHQAPFYSNSKDVCSNSSRLLESLPISVDPIRFRPPFSALQLYKSTGFESGLRHWQLVLAAHDRLQCFNENNSSNDHKNFLKQSIDPSRIFIVKPLKSAPNSLEVRNKFAGSTLKQNKNQLKGATSECVNDVTCKSTELRKEDDNKHHRSLSAANLVEKKCHSSTNVEDAASPTDECISSSKLETSSLKSSNSEHMLSISEIDGPSLSNSFGFLASQQDLANAKALHESQHIRLMSVELHIKTRIDLLPDPEMDEIRALFYATQNDVNSHITSGCIIVESDQSVNHAAYVSTNHNFTTTHVMSESDLFGEISSLIRQFDPDILLGYEVQMLSWGYLLARAAHLGHELCSDISRIPSDSKNNWCSAEKDAYGADNASEIHIVGRVVLNLWRLMRTEVALNDYKFENVVFHLLHQRYPHYAHRTLTLWFDQPTQRRGSLRNRVIDYYLKRVVGNVQLISQQDLIGRTSELARLFGIQFYEVLTRGSQYRVEGMMLRLARSLNYVAVSPSVIQRAKMKAPECIPLVMEPESKFYSEPVIVVDFQSLYPSVIIAHNYCYSTCLGRIDNLKRFGNIPFGCTSLNTSLADVNQLLKNDDLTVSPNGVVFVKKRVRTGILPIMLDEILNTRIMVKESMKKCDDKATKTMLNHRQLGLKLIANVTYGYTSASFSGRMACVEIADSIVGKAREILQSAISLVHDEYKQWGARVVYGDTDSMFIALKKGTSKAAAFKIGRSIVEAVTSTNPIPIKLKLEKIYLPCILQTKKRYVGYAYESEDQLEPIFDAKGIETVRRDGCPAVAKILQKSIQILFNTKDVSKVKGYVEKQCMKVLGGSSTLQDCTIAKEYRGAKYYKPGAVVPALVLIRKMIAVDKRSEPRLGERVPYVVVHGAPGTPLFNLVRHPRDVLLDPHLRLNGTYYVIKMILPALDRIMSLMGVDVFNWYQSLPRKVQTIGDVDVLRNEDRRKGTLSQYFDTHNCLCCKAVSTSSICVECIQGPSKQQRSVVQLSQEISRSERRFHELVKVCITCTGAVSLHDIKCQSMACPVLYKLSRAQQQVNRAHSLRMVLLNSSDLNW